MGYYVHIDDSNFFISKDNFEEAFRACIALNDRDDLKKGGGGAFTLPNGEEMKYNDPRPEGMSYHPMKWFSWMSPNYPATCHTLNMILEELGFDIALDDQGNIISLQYNNKIGSECHFLDAISPFVKSGSFINWVGEDNDLWRNEFDGKKMITKQANITWI